MRAHGHPQGLNGRKDTVVAYLDLKSGKVDELPSPDGLFADLPGPQPMKPAAPRGNNPKAKAKAKGAEPKKKGNQPPPNEVAAVNLPHLMIDAAGRPWLTVRYFKAYCWRIALTRYDASVLSSDLQLARYFEAALHASIPAKKTANFLINNILGTINERGIAIEHCPVPPQSLTSLLELVENGTLAANQAREVFIVMLEQPDKAAAAIASYS